MGYAHILFSPSLFFTCLCVFLRFSMCCAMAAIGSGKDFFMAFIRKTAVGTLNSLGGLSIPFVSLQSLNKVRNDNTKYYNAVTTDLEQRGIFNGSSVVNKAVVGINKPLKPEGSTEGSSAKNIPRSTYSSIYLAPSTSSAPTSAEAIDYKDADLAKHYGMDAKTAYQEALNNTAIRRQMADLKAAGLNPVLAASYGGAPSTVYNATLQAESSIGNSSVYSGSSGSYRNSSKSGKGLLSDSNARQAIASTASAAVGALTKNFALGASAYYATQYALNLANKLS